MKNSVNLDKLEKLPKEQQEIAEKVLYALQDAHNNDKIGLNITTIRKTLNVSNTQITKGLTSLLTLEMVKMEKIGTSKIYSIKEET